MPARRAVARAREPGHRPQQCLHRMARGQIDRKSARPELAVAIGILDRANLEILDAVVLFALGLAEAIEIVDKPPVRRQQVAVRDHIGEVTGFAEDTNKEKVLAGLGAGKAGCGRLRQDLESNPLAPGQFHPRGLALIPVQDDGVIGSSFIMLPRSYGAQPPRFLVATLDPCTKKKSPRSYAAGRMAGIDQPTLRFSADSLPRLLTTSY